MEDEVRWVNMVKNNPMDILYISYRDFASIKVEKKESKTRVLSFEITVDVYAVTTPVFTLYKFTELEKALVKLKAEIEKLYETISDFDEEDLDKWIVSFNDMINEF